MKVQAPLLGLLLAFSALVSPASGQAGGPYQTVTFCQLAANPSAYGGKRIKVRGIYRFVLEMNDLEQPECCPGKNLEKIAVIINGNPMFPDPNSQRLARKLWSSPDGVALTIFDGTLNGRVLEVERIERVDHLARPRDREHDPSWVPRGCASTGNSTAPVKPTASLEHPFSEAPE